MRITNLQFHGSTDPKLKLYYTAELVEEGNKIPVQFSQNSGRDDWTAYDLSTGNAYPVLCVGDPDKMNDITTWRDGDIIVLDNICIPEP